MGVYVKYNKLWLGAEIFLFVLVGIAVDLKYALAAGVVVILLVILDDVDVMSAVKVWMSADDVVLRELSKGFIERRFFNW